MNTCDLERLCLIFNIWNIGRPTVCSVEDFTCERFQAAFREVMENRASIRSGVADRLDCLIRKLDRNEELIREILGGAGR